MLISNPESRFDTIEDALQALQNGEVIIVADDEDRENEGDFVCAAEHVTPEIINFMINKGRGLVCLTLAPEFCDKLDLFPMAPPEKSTTDTPFMVSIDAREPFGVSTGISAFDRATTIRTAISDSARSTDFHRPGHVFPLKAKAGGVLERTGQTEASVDLARIAGLKPAGVLCEILNDDGTMARREDLLSIAKHYHLKFITVSQLVEYRQTVLQERLEKESALVAF